jgi:hypothetical protein
MMDAEPILLPLLHDQNQVVEVQEVEDKQDAPDLQLTHGDATKLTNLHYKLMQLAYKVDVSLKTFHNKIMDINI